MRSAAVLHGVYPHQYRGKGDACAQGASKVACSEAAHDGQVRNRISDLTIVCRLGVGPLGCCVTVHVCHVSRCQTAGLPA